MGELSNYWSIIFLREPNRKKNVDIEATKKGETSKRNFAKRETKKTEKKKTEEKNTDV